MHRVSSLLIFCVLLSSSSAKNAPFYRQVLLSLCFSTFSVRGYLCWQQQWIESARMNGRAHQVCTKDPDCHGLDGAHQEFWRVTWPSSLTSWPALGTCHQGVQVGRQPAGVCMAGSLYRRFIFMLQCESPALVFTVDATSKQCKARQGERRGFLPTAYAGELPTFTLNLTQRTVHISDIWFILTVDPGMKVSVATSLEAFSALSCFWSFKKQCQ